MKRHVRPQDGRMGAPELDSGLNPAHRLLVDEVAAPTEAVHAAEYENVLSGLDLRAVVEHVGHGQGCSRRDECRAHSVLLPEPFKRYELVRRSHSCMFQVRMIWPLCEVPVAT